MSKINKIVTNYPVSLTNEEVENLSLTLSAVRTAGGGGGGGEGKIYHGEGFVTVNNTSNAISLTTEANEKLNQPIPTKVSDLSDSANYQTVAGMSDYSTKDVADTLYAPISVTGDVDTLKSSSGNWNKVSAKLDTSAFSSVSGKFISASYPFTADLGGGSKLSVTNGATAVFTNDASFSSFANTLIQGIANTTILGNSFCQGTNNTADGDSLAQGSVNYAKNTSIAQGSVNSAINCSQAFGVGNAITDTGMAIGKYNKTSSDASFVIGNGTNSNRSDLFIIKHDGTVSSTGDFIVDGKSLSSVYDTVSTNSGDWLKESDLNEYATKSDLETTSGKLLTTAQYQTDSATFALKTEIPTTVAQLTDSGNYYLKTETSGISELNTAFGNKQDNLTQEQLSAISSVSSIKGTVLAGDANIRTTSAEEGNNVKWTLELTAQPVVTDTTLSGHNGIVAVKDSSVSSQWNISIAQAYKERIEEVSGKLDTSVAASTYQTKADMSNYLTTATYATDSATFLTAHQSLSSYYQKTETSGANELATEFAKYVTSSDITTQDTDYVMTTTGWKVLTLPGGGMTQVIHDTTLTGQGNADDSKLGVAWSALSGNTIASANTAGSAASAEFAEKTWVPQGEGLPPYTANIGYNIKILHDFIDDIYLEPNWFPRETPIYADYAMSAYISENNVSGFNHIVNAINAKLDTTAAAQTYLSASTYATDSATFVTSSNSTITGTKQYALTTAGWKEVSTPTIPDITANNGLSANGHTVGISTTNIDANKQYAWTTAGWEEVSTPTIPAITAESGISADGYKIGLTTTAINAISSVSSKLDTSALTVNTANNAITLATGPSTSASVSAVNYKANYSEPLVVPQRIVVALNDQDIINHISYYSDNQYGTIIFVTSAHTY